MYFIVKRCRLSCLIVNLAIAQIKPICSHTSYEYMSTHYNIIHIQDPPLIQLSSLCPGHVIGYITASEAQKIFSGQLLLDEESSQMTQLPSTSHTQNTELYQSPSHYTGVGRFGLVAELSFSLLFTNG